MLGIGARPVSFDPWWRSLLWCHHHDTIGGTTIKTSDQFAQQVLGDVLGMVTNHLQQTLSNLTEAIDTRGVSDHSRVVFNPLAWPVTAPAWMSLPDETNRWEWVDPTGHSAPVQRTEDGRGVAVLGPLPPLGYRVGCLRAANGKAPGGLTRSDFLCRNRQLEMEISPQSGNIRRLVDRDSQQNWVPENLQSGRLRIDFESPHEMSAWEIGPIERTEWLDKAEAVNCIEEGPVRVVFRSKYKFQNSTLQKDIILYRDLDRVDFELLVDWKERGDFQHAAPMLRIEFPSALQKPRAVWLIPFGAIQRSQDALDYAASYGMGFDAEQGSICLVNNSKNGYSAREGTLRLTLLRSSYHPDPEPDVGLHRIPLALEISGRGWEKAGMARKGIEFNRQPTVIEAKPHRGKFPSQQSFVAVEPETIVLTALKPSFASPTNFVARLYQSAGTPATARLISCLPFGPWIKTDLIERSSPNEPAVETSSLPVHGWEIKTYMSRQPKLSN
jgi:alpha-mannosidase